MLRRAVSITFMLCLTLSLPLMGYAQTRLAAVEGKVADETGRDAAWRHRDPDEPSAAGAADDDGQRR